MRQGSSRPSFSLPGFSLLWFVVSTLRRVAEDHVAVDWPVTDSGYAVSRRRLLVRGNTLDPDPAHPRWRPVRRGNRGPLREIFREARNPRLQLERQLRIRWPSRREKPRGEKSEPPSIHLPRGAPRERKDCHGIGDSHRGCQSGVGVEVMNLQRLTAFSERPGMAGCHLSRTALGETLDASGGRSWLPGDSGRQCTAVSIVAASFR